MDRYYYISVSCRLPRHEADIWGNRPAEGDATERSIKQLFLGEKTVATELYINCDICKIEIIGGHYNLPEATVCCTCFDRFLRGKVDAEAAIILHELRLWKALREKGYDTRML